MKLRTRLAVPAFAAALVALAFASSASANYHLMKISEVHVGSGGGDVDFVELQMYTAGQNLVQTHYIRTYDNGGNELSTFQFPTSVANGDSQRTILVAAGPTAGGVAADFNAIGDLNVAANSGGAVCFIDQLPATGVDCVAMGTFGSIVGGNPSPFGTPVQGTGVSMGLAPGESIHRSIAPGCRFQLEAGDDTDDSATDFATGPASPRNNATKPTEMPCVPCPTNAKLATVVGTPGADVLVGTPQADRIAGLGGRDKIRGLGGNDTLCGGGAKDRLLGGKGRDILLGQGGPDILLGQRGRDILRGGPGRDVLRGGPGRDKLRGGPGRDRQFQ